jgi:hypothetical protein
LYETTATETASKTADVQAHEDVLSGKAAWSDGKSCHCREKRRDPLMGRTGKHPTIPQTRFAAHEHMFSQRRETRIVREKTEIRWLHKEKSTGEQQVAIEYPKQANS